MTVNKRTWLQATARLPMTNWFRSWKERFRLIAIGRFALSGLISASLFSLFLAYQWAVTGTPLSFLDAQSHWAHVDSLVAAIGTIWFANPWQNPSFGALLHHLYFWILVAATVATWRQNKPLALYCCMSLGVILLQGEMANSFRFGTVLFGLQFALGDLLAKQHKWLQWACFLALLLLNLKVTFNFAVDRWAY